MSITQQRRFTAADAGHALPAVLMLVLLGVAAMLSTVAPSRVTTGVDEVILGEGAEQQVVLSADALDCEWLGNTARCTAPVAGRPLTVAVGYGGDARKPHLVTDCTAAHGGRRMECRAGIGDYGHASATVWLHDDLDLTAAELAGLRDALPWWRVGNGLGTALIALWLTLTAASGVAAFLLGPRLRPLPARWRLPAVGGCFLLGPLLVAATGLLLEPTSGWVYVTAPPEVLLAVLPALWQWQLACGRGRWWHATVAVVTTLPYVAVALFVVLLQGGFID